MTDQYLENGFMFGGRVLYCNSNEILNNHNDGSCHYKKKSPEDNSAAKGGYVDESSYEVITICRDDGSTVKLDGRR